MRYNKGKRARFISDRSGLPYPRNQMVKEPGTGFIVAKEESDGRWNLKDHPLNKPPKLKPERIGLKDPRPPSGDFKDKYLINDWDHSEQVNPGQTLEKDVPIMTEEGGTILIEGYDD